MSYLIETIRAPLSSLAQDPSNQSAPASSASPAEEGFSPVLVVSAIVLGLLIGDGLFKSKQPPRRTRGMSYV